MDIVPASFPSWTCRVSGTLPRVVLLKTTRSDTFSHAMKRRDPQPHRGILHWQNTITLVPVQWINPHRLGKCYVRCKEGRVFVLDV